MVVQVVIELKAPVFITLFLSFLMFTMVFAPLIPARGADVSNDTAPTVRYGRFERDTIDGYYVAAHTHAGALGAFIGVGDEGVFMVITQHNPIGAIKIYEGGKYAGTRPIILHRTLTYVLKYAVIFQDTGIEGVENTSGNGIFDYYPDMDSGLYADYMHEPVTSVIALGRTNYTGHIDHENLSSDGRWDFQYTITLDSPRTLKGSTVLETLELTYHIHLERVQRHGSIPVVKVYKDGDGVRVERGGKIDGTASGYNMEVKYDLRAVFANRDGAIVAGNGTRYVMLLGRVKYGFALNATVMKVASGAQLSRALGTYIIRSGDTKVAVEPSEGDGATGGGGESNGYGGGNDAWCRSGGNLDIHGGGGSDRVRRLKTRATYNLSDAWATLGERMGLKWNETCIVDGKTHTVGVEASNPMLISAPFQVAGSDMGFRGIGFHLGITYPLGREIYQDPGMFAAMYDMPINDLMKSLINLRSEGLMLIEAVVIGIAATSYALNARKRRRTKGQHQ